MTTISDETVDLIKWCNDVCNNRGAEVVIAGYPIMITEEMDNVEIYSDFYNEIQIRTGLRVISDPKKYMMPTDMFYDSQLHLNYKGVNLRTQLLIEDLQNAIIGRE